MSTDKTILTLFSTLILGTVFIALKLFNVIAWSWWIVFIPWSMLALSIAVVAGMFVVAIWGMDDSDFMEDYY